MSRQWPGVFKSTLTSLVIGKEQRLNSPYLSHFTTNLNIDMHLLLQKELYVTIFGFKFKLYSPLLSTSLIKLDYVCTCIISGTLPQPLCLIIPSLHSPFCPINPIIIKVMLRHTRAASVTIDNYRVKRSEHEPGTQTWHCHQQLR